ncbi:glycine cleavage system protein GcvH [Kitasatospora sp. DSM 101779]|uniref:glycine cleavage system protein GcvH n=1 Tax=Kitasatospora sp. DSM 101779 TaxID=2853165 RepID=UPI0021D8F8A9|nr:glycine cleavage system protein GcvH [Kitasatospora sp. DSM 101779]MCU7826636.1 glycine cleavage system protein GcvH [Kitasatospora sp. DSM 101779]
MANIPDDLKYTKEHEWVRDLGKGRVRVGITDHAQRQLGDIVFVELPSVGRTLDAGEAFGTVESVKSVAEIYAPLAGKVAGVNDLLADEPETSNTDPYDEGWLIEIELAKGTDLKGLLSAADYRAWITEGAD